MQLSSKASICTYTPQSEYLPVSLHVQEVSLNATQQEASVSCLEAGGGRGGHEAAQHVRAQQRHGRVREARADAHLERLQQQLHLLVYLHLHTNP